MATTSDKTAVIRLDMALESVSSRLVILIMPNGESYAGRIELLTEKQTKVSDLIAKHRR